MSRQQRRLPLFPLNVVLFPNATLPLHVFEERYKRMVQDWLDADSLFGVVLIKSGAEVGGPAEPYDVGTVARIAQVNRLDDGRMILSVVGQVPFRIVELAETEPYMTARAEMLEEEGVESVASEEVERVRKATMQHVRLIVGIKGGWVDEPKLPKDPTTLSYFVAPALQIGLPQKQALLEERNTAERLAAELGIMEQEAEALSQRMGQDFRRRFGRQ